MARLAQRLALFVFLAAAVATAWGAFAPHEGPELHLMPWDKARHFSAFAVMTTSAILAFPRTRLSVIAGLLSLAGAAIEVVQGLPMVHRDADVFDWVADSTAIVMVLAIILAARFRRDLDGESL